MVCVFRIIAGYCYQRAGACGSILESYSIVGASILNLLFRISDAVLSGVHHLTLPCAHTTRAMHGRTCVLQKEDRRSC